MEQFIDVMPLPVDMESVSSNPPATICWLAELSIRRLLNRVHHTMYYAPAKLGGLQGSHARDDRRSLYSLIRVSSELDRQLEAWYYCLPDTVRPSLEDTSTLSPFELNILLRYYSAKEIIFRPFVLHVSSLAETDMAPQILLELCEKCITSCQRYLTVACQRLESPSASREIVIHSYVESLLIKYCL